MSKLNVLHRSSHLLTGTFGRRTEKSFRVRLAVQVFFSLVSILMGVQLARFYLAAKAGATPLPTRPPGVDGYLPISGLMGVVDWFHQGELNQVHPAATVLVLVALGLALFARKAFCSWMCPVGLASELLARCTASGFAAQRVLREDPHFSGLRGEAEFAELLAGQ